MTMNRGLAIGLASGIFGCLLVAREWLIHQEVDSTRQLTRTQLQDQLGAAQDWSTLENLSATPTVFERFFEPVLLTANKLLWPPSREEILLNWRRELNQTVPEMTRRRHDDLLAEANRLVEDLKVQEPASMSRLLKTLEHKAHLLKGDQVDTIVRAEIKEVGETAYAQDRQTLVTIKSEGRRVFKDLKAKLKKLDAKGLSQYLASGDFHREFQEPILQLVLSLKQESLRARTWGEFQKTMLETLGHRKALFAGAQKKRNLEAKIKEDEQRFMNLFNSVAEAVRQEEADRVAEPKRPQPLPALPPNPADSPAALDYQD